MSMISKKSIYGLNAMYILALNTNGTLLKAKEISKKGNIPLNFLEQILIILKKDKLVKSIRGQKGGYKLYKSSDEISVYDILESLESCISCIPIEENQLLSSFWKETRGKIDNIFNISLEELVKKNKTNIIFSI